MTRLFLLLAVLVLLAVTAFLTYGWWHPVVQPLSDELQGLVAIVSMLAIVGGGLWAFLKLRGKSPPSPSLFRETSEAPIPSSRGTRPTSRLPFSMRTRPWKKTLLPTWA